MCLLSYVSYQARSSLLTSKDQDSPETRLAWPGGLARREARTSQMERFQSYCGPGRAWREIVFKWTIIKTLLRLRVLSGFSETNHTKWFLVRLLKISRKNLNSSFARIITRSQRERERREISRALDDWEGKAVRNVPATQWRDLPWQTFVFDRQI